jgi:hypothetical protein
MDRNALAVILTLSLAGCAGAPGSEASPPGSAGRTALSVIGTPFLIAFKIPVCVASAAIAVPLASAAQLAGTEQGARLEDNLGDGLERNCGPPYVLAP